jgi:hypothetical protein
VKVAQQSLGKLIASAWSKSTGVVRDWLAWLEAGEHTEKGEAGSPVKEPARSLNSMSDSKRPRCKTQGGAA